MKVILYLVWIFVLNYIKGGCIALVFFYVGACLLNYVCFPLIFSENGLSMFLGLIIFLGYIIGSFVLFIKYVLDM